MPHIPSVSHQEAEPRVSMVEEAYAVLKRAIRESEFAPGHQVSAQELALRIGTSRTPIHEACLRLQEEGLVRILPKKGILICALAPDDIREIFEVIIAIEGAAAALAAGLPTDQRLSIAAALDAETLRMTNALAGGDFVERSASDADFHRILVEKCGNSRFVRIMQTVNDQSHRARVLTARMRTTLAQSIPEHHAIANAIREGHAELAYTAARAHRIRARDEILPLIAEFGLRHM